MKSLKKCIKNYKKSALDLGMCIHETAKKGEAVQWLSGKLKERYSVISKVQWINEDLCVRLTIETYSEDKKKVEFVNDVDLRTEDDFNENFRKIPIDSYAREG